MRALKPGVSENRYKSLLGYLPDPPIRFILYFPVGSIQPSPESVPARDALFAEIKRRGAGVDVQIEGHTDRLGDASDNDRLSLERAVAARDMLLGYGLSQNITRVVGRGERDPMPGHATADGVEDPVNRRVEVVVR
jgi:outer membrane protein OmpA-like peptidoglycan-associated protein